METLIFAFRKREAGTFSRIVVTSTLFIMFLFLALAPLFGYGH